jgi:hypothetical protein
LSSNQTLLEMLIVLAGLDRAAGALLSGGAGGSGFGRGGIWWRSGRAAGLHADLRDRERGDWFRPCELVGSCGRSGGGERPVGIGSEEATEVLDVELRQAALFQLVVADGQESIARHAGEGGCLRREGGG